MITEINCKWNEQKAKLKLRFAALTEGDLRFEPGKKEEMLDRLHCKLGKTIEELHKIIDGFK
jgi:hypothetical protein